MKRPYTGNTDGLAQGERKGLAVFIKELCALYPALWNNGSFVNRPKRGSSSMSVHATGRACDLSYRFMPKEKRGIKEGGRKQAMVFYHLLPMSNKARLRTTILGSQLI